MICKTGHKTLPVALEATEQKGKLSTDSLNINFKNAARQHLFFLLRFVSIFTLTAMGSHISFSDTLLHIDIYSLLNLFI